MRRRYFLERGEVSPQVYLRLTDNWIEATVRFVAPDHGIRDLKDRITRDVLDAFDRDGISVASATIDVAGVPPLRVEAAPGRGEGGEGGSRPGRPPW